MDEKFELYSEFQLEGVFWDTAKPDDKFAGTLSCDGKRLELVTRAELVTPTPDMFMGTNEESVPDVVHGFTVKGDCTIIGLQQINRPGLLDYSRGRGVRWRYFRVIGACVMGLHLANDNAEVLTGADLTYTGISDWFPGCGASITFPGEVLDVGEIHSARKSDLWHTSPQFVVRRDGISYPRTGNRIISSFDGQIYGRRATAFRTS